MQAREHHTSKHKHFSNHTISLKVWHTRDSPHYLIISTTGSKGKSGLRFQTAFKPNTPSCKEMKLLKRPSASIRVVSSCHRKDKVAERDHGPFQLYSLAPISPRVSTSTKVAAVPAHPTFVGL